MRNDNRTVPVPHTPPPPYRGEGARLRGGGGTCACGTPFKPFGARGDPCTYTRALRGGHMRLCPLLTQGSDRKQILRAGDPRSVPTI